MDTYQPADAQIEALADEMEEMRVNWQRDLRERPEDDSIPPLADYLAEHVAPSLAFQSIIRVAQAEAVDAAKRALDRLPGSLMRMVKDTPDFRRGIEYAGGYVEAIADEYREGIGGEMTGIATSAIERYRGALDLLAER